MNSEALLPALPFPSERIQTARVSIGGRTLRFRHLREVDSLFDTLSPAELSDEKLPYYGELWPASIGLARWIGRRLELTGKRVLDLGCGVAVGGIAAALRGARVTLADYFEEALAFARHNAALNGAEGVRTLWLDWRDASFRERFEYILGCDVTYEARHHAPILDLIERCLEPGGAACFADPGRVTLERFVDAVRTRGLDLQREELGVQEAGERVRAIHILVVRFSARGGAAPSARSLLP
ncbi:MAG: methyltransferase domain-containing protein [Planctomycetes bacterium]|nr:methyltransferase domain-containing protein [Planctomycetota bacterium]